jgi:hypothetical protein
VLLAAAAALEAGLGIRGLLGLHRAAVLLCRTVAMLSNSLVLLQLQLLHALRKVGMAVACCRAVVAGPHGHVVRWGRELRACPQRRRRLCLHWEAPTISAMLLLLLLLLAAWRHKERGAAAEAGEVALSAGKAAGPGRVAD